MNSIYKPDNLISQGPYRMTFWLTKVCRPLAAKLTVVRCTKLFRRQGDGIVKPFNRHTGGSFWVGRYLFYFFGFISKDLVILVFLFFL